MVDQWITIENLKKQNFQKLSMAEIIPTVFVKEGEDFDSRFRKVVGISNFVQIDFMDGKFVKAKSIDLDIVPMLRGAPSKFEAHLMVKDPEAWVEDLSKKGFERVIFHYESMKDNMEIKLLAGTIKRYHMKPIIAINPETKVEKILPVLDVINHVLLMGVEPGKEHQEFILETKNKIRELRKLKPTIKIQVDGGVTLENAHDISDAGCDFLNSGSVISESESPRATYMKLQELVDDLSEEDGWE